jgi:RNA polymerase sigma-32 factor
MSVGGDDSSFTPMDFIPAESTSIETDMADGEISDLLRDKIKGIIPDLNDKEKDILYDRLLAEKPLTLREIGEKYGITRERVRQIEARLLKKLKEHLSQEITDFSEEWISDR